MFRESPGLGTVDGAGNPHPSVRGQAYLETRRSLSIRGSRMFSGKKYLRRVDNSYLAVLGASEQQDGRACYG
jgi:hypothetical protein